MSENKVPQPITEEEGIHESWYAQAKDMTLENLPEFIRRLTEDYSHDYGTICHAISSAALAAAHAVEQSPQGGITGFQAGAVMWGFVCNWMTEYKDKPIRLTDFSNLLYPQYEEKFTTISKHTWEWVQKKAGELINDPTKSHAHSDVVDHWENIVLGHIPFGLKLEEE